MAAVVPNVAASICFKRANGAWELLLHQALPHGEGVVVGAL
jgi:hypothetical protein